MAEFDPRATFERFVALVNGGDVNALDQILHPDFEETWPQSGERVRGVANFKAILANYPGGPQKREIERIVGSEDRWVVTPSQTLLRIGRAGEVYTGVFRTRYPDGSRWYVIEVVEFKDQRVWRVQTFFSPEYEAPEWRRQWVERVEVGRPRG